MKETQETIASWRQEAHGNLPSIARIATRANEEMAEMLAACTSTSIDPSAIMKEAADVVICLCALATGLGMNLGYAIDAKMEMNRARKWNVVDGVGYHVKDAK